MKSKKHWIFAATLASTAAVTQFTFAKPGLPTPAQALEFAPVQPDINYTRPAEKEIEKCRLDVDTSGGVKSYVVTNEAGQTLRRFVDSNSDNKVDMWCYFDEGIEVYRDIDSDSNGKADQYRWLGVAGLRWGLDPDEDTQINSWKQISAEEATEEVVSAIRTKDLPRFRRLLLSADDVKSLDIHGDTAAELERLTATAIKDFPGVASKQKTVGGKTKWVSFGGGKPGLVTSASVGGKTDLVVYDNVAAVVENEKDHAQIAIGTMVRVGDAWRVIDIPRNLLDDTNHASSTGFFFQQALAKAGESAPTPGGGISSEMQALVTDLEKLDKELANAPANKQKRLNEQRVELLEKICELARGEDRETWFKQYIEAVSIAMQEGDFEAGLARLKRLQSQLAKQDGQDNLLIFTGYRVLQADYNQALKDAKESEIPKIYSTWFDGLKLLVARHADNPEIAEVLLQLANECENSGKEDDAVGHYTSIITKFPKSELVPKAAGAKRRLESLGKVLTISGTTIDGKTLNPAALQGKVVVVQYWANWCDVCKSDFATLKSLQAKYGKQGFGVIGINLDSNKEDAIKVLKTASLPWPNLYEPGGFDSRFANEMGVFTLPLMILMDKQGRVISRNITAGELDSELKKLLK